MGRLFWKFFFFIWLAQMTAIVGVGATFWLENRARSRHLENIDRSPPAGTLVESAAAVLRHGGPAVLRKLLGDAPHSLVYVVDENDRELLGRAVADSLIKQARSVLADVDAPQAVRQVKGEDGVTWLLFLPNNGAQGGPPHGKHPHPGGPRLPMEPLIAAMLVSLIFAVFLARYFSKPIHILRHAFEAAAAGDLEVKPSLEMGKRRDELAGLGRDFERMAGRLLALLEGQRRLLHDVSHELRSPLARLQAAVGLARQQPDKFEASMARLELEAQRIDKLVGELLTLSRLDAGVICGGEEEIALDELLGDIAEDARFEAEGQGRRVELAASCAALLRGRAELLHRAIENVVRNALRHTPPDSAVCIESRLAADGETVIVAILDEGPGVAEAELEKIFEPFFRGSHPPNRDGHGLGLAIARRVIESHGGVIRAVNRESGGLRVEMVLPLK